jgi:hypothetical protein
MWLLPERHGDSLVVHVAPDPLPRQLCQVCGTTGDVVCEVPGFAPALIRCPYCGPLHLHELANPRARVEITSAQ